MGCGSSKSVVAVAPLPVDKNANSSKTTNFENKKNMKAKQLNDGSNGYTSCVADNTEMISKVRPNSACSTSSGRKIKKTDSVYGSTTSLKRSDKDLSTNEQSRVISASSSKKNRKTSSCSSRGTVDSGVWDSERQSGRFEGNLITENSSPSLIRKIEEQRPDTPELSIDGKKIQGRSSSKARHRQAVLDARKGGSCQSLQGLSGSKTPSKHENIAFDIMLCPVTGNVKKKPEKLAKLQEQSVARRKKKSKKATSKKDIEQKLQEAEDRRKVVEMEKQAKARMSQKLAHSSTPVVELRSNEDADEGIDDEVRSTDLI